MNRILLVLSVCVVLCNTSCKPKSAEKEEVEKYAATSPIRLDTSITKEYVAQIQAIKNIELRAQKKGYLQKIYADEGKFVKSGQVLFQIMPSLHQAEYLKTQAAVKEAQLEMENAKTLADKDIVSKSEAAIAQAKLEEAKADMNLSKLHLSFTKISAPFSGVIDRIPLKVGSLIDEGALLTTLSDNSSVYAYFNVTENEYLSYKNQTDNSSIKNVSLKLANNDLFPNKGVIETVEGQFDNETGNIAFRAKFPNPDLLLKHGETGKVVMTIPIKNALIVPQKATYELQDKMYLFVIDKNNVVTARNITVLHRLPDIFIIDDKNLNEGDKILLEGVQKVKDGDKIKFDFEEPRTVLEHLKLKAE